MSPDRMNTDSLPLVTIITPTYNRAPLLAETIESVMAQDYPRIEYLLLDDGSSDGTRELVERLQQRYPGRIHYSYHDNMGEADTVNKGWQQAKGDFVTVINSDDPQPPFLIRRSVEVMMEDPSVLVTYPDWRMTDINGRTTYHYTLQDYSYEHMVKLCHCFIGPGAMINRKALAGRITRLRNKKYPYVSDFECWLNIGLMGRFRHIPEPLAVWRSHEGSITISKSMRMAEMVAELMDDYFRRDDLPAHIRALETQAKTTAAGLLLRHECKRRPQRLLRIGMMAMRHPAEVLRFFTGYAKIALNARAA